MTSVLLVTGVVLLLAAAFHDIAFRTVPNMLAAALAVCGSLLRAESGCLASSAVAAFVVFAAAALCWWRGWMGGGDVKLLAAAAFMVPPMQVPLMLAFVAMAGGVLALPYLLARHRLARPASRRSAMLLVRILRVERWRLGRGGPLPYAVAIFLGVGATIMQGAQ